ncbi:MAG TPA: ATP-binding cassette domain-containing protein [Syntrophomonadaceae bacterium]|nr:ATP-binding cassette domain-containing protein [Syntrophomonadaceae bacterium]HQE24188.1 ATP-binding cassette domain-containing protein [Syntrophomonadaceae bacterium]
MLEIRGLSKTFAMGSINEKLAVDEVDLTLKAGEFVTVIGGNGAGKSTLLNCIAGVYEADKGSILLDSMDITHWPEYKRSQYIGRVFQDPLKGTAFDMTIEENLAMAYAKGKPHGLQWGIRRADAALFRDHLARLGLGLENRMKQKVGLLSGGQRQALTLLMATIVKPKLLLLDEHTAALDPSAARQVLHLTRELVEQYQLCTLMVTHNMKAALEYGTRTIMMHDGRIILDISGEERREMTVDKLIELFGRRSGQELDSDRLLLG